MSSSVIYKFIFGSMYFVFPLQFSAEFLGRCHNLSNARQEEEIFQLSEFDFFVMTSVEQRLIHYCRQTEAGLTFVKTHLNTPARKWD